jgi:hypothetical protein
LVVTHFGMELCVTFHVEVIKLVSVACIMLGLIYPILEVNMVIRSVLSYSPCNTVEPRSIVFQGSGENKRMCENNKSQKQLFLTKKSHKLSLADGA